MVILMRTIKVNLSVKGINDLINKMDDLQEGIEKANKNIVEKLSDYALEEIQNNYAATLYKDGNEDVAFFKKGDENSKSVGVSGKQVLYNEFGTGEAGANDGHEMKGDFNLRPYNSGKTIRTAKPGSNAEAEGIPVNGLYWTYRDEQGQKRYTQGIPAGKQVLNAAISLEKKQKEIIKKEVGEALSKL